MATATMANQQQPPPPPYSKTDEHNHHAAAAIKPTDVSHLIHPEPQQHHSSPPQQSQDLVTAAHTLTLLTKTATTSATATPPSDADTIITDNNSATPSPQQIYDQQLVNADGEQLVGLQQRHPFVLTVSMVAKHPIVINVVKYYEDSKRNYPSFNYAAGIMESAALPVVNNIEAKLNTRYQTRQASVVSSASNSNDITPTNSLYGDYKIQSNNSGGVQKKRRFSNTSQTTTYSTIDTRKRLQFCINILKLANTNISSKVAFLHEKINETEIAVKEEREKLIAQKSNESAQHGGKEDPTTQKTKTEIVGTVKKIIHLISNFRPSSLGDTNNSNGLSPVSSNGSSQMTTTSAAANQDLELKNAIRDIILSLPQSLQQQQESGSPQDDVIFKFAKESLVMIGRLTQIFTEKLDQVETWVNGDEEQQRQQPDQAELEQKIKDDEEEEHLAAETKRMKIDESR
ncbi:hypothetical protein Cantr_03831 [Candida viswanathii]|uniref:Transcriptional repressor OPI1 n=1 Tax=Candida viswanathii TaxID=5486 RepID=A0A367XMT1_9ASCO|nr:hypothetical protein Cantr_03831 [Candida viswanathii]